jgi:hypothetical protein
MPRDPVLTKAMEKPDEAVREAHEYEELNGKNTEEPRRLRKPRISSDLPTNKPAPPGHHRGGRARPPQQLDLYGGSAVADGRLRQVRPSIRKSTIGVRCPLCGSEILVVAIALTMECPGCHAIVDALEVTRVNRIGVAAPPGRSRSSMPAQRESRWQAAEPILPEALPSFFFRPAQTVTETSTAQTPTSRTYMVRMAWIALGVTVLSGAVAGAAYWRIHPKQREVAPEVAASLLAPPVPAMVPPQPPPRLVVGLPQLGNRQADEPAILPVAAPPVAAATAEAPPSVPAGPVPQDLATAKPVAAPADNVFVVRFDSKLPGLTPSGLRALDAALRAVDKGNKVRIEIAGCEDHDSTPKAIDCAALARGLKWILAHRGVNHRADLIDSLRPPTIPTAGWFAF